MLASFARRFHEQCDIRYISTLRRGGHGAGCRVRLVFDREGLLPRPSIGVTSHDIFFSRAKEHIHAGGRVAKSSKRVQGNYAIVGGNRMCRDRLFAAGSAHFGKRPFLQRVGRICARLVGHRVSSPRRRLGIFSGGDICLPAGGVNGGGPGTSRVGTSGTTERR